MPKRLVVCCDGTWNTPDQLSDGAPAPTNVTKVKEAIAPQDHTGREQLTFYNRGVGTNRQEPIGGTALGLSLSHDVLDTYRFLVENFEPRDELFFFGFSRGAYTARSTVGLVRNSGILRPMHDDRVDEAYELYRGRSIFTSPQGKKAQLFRSSYSYETRIRFIGVWDTVGPLGIPFSASRLINLRNRRWEFHDTSLSTSVDAAFQALAIDEKRREYQPTIWTQRGNVDGQRLEQVWFAGVHCDVGGGYLDPGLADIALLWIADRARSCGLAFEADAFVEPSPIAHLPPGDAATPRATDKVSANVFGQLHDPCARLHESRRGLYRLSSPFFRSIGVTDKAHEYVASTAVERMQRTPDYRPLGLASYLGRAPQVMPINLRWI